MKRVVSILFASLILLSGVHLTIASHICCGELAAVKWSVTGEKASCGMEDYSEPCSVNGEIGTDCCKNHIAACCADNHFFPSFQSDLFTTTLDAPQFFTVLKIINTFSGYSKTYHSMVGPPIQTFYNSPDQSFICVFII